MIKIFLLNLLLSFSAFAYVPTVESLFRHGSNPEITANGISMTLIVKKIQAGIEKSAGTLQDVSLVKEHRPEDFFRIFFTKSGNETLKVAQSRYTNGGLSEDSLEHKIYYPNFTAYTIKSDIEHLEKGIFFSLLNSIVMNNGAYLLNYLKKFGVPVKLNSEIINREKIGLFASYKSYLVTINKDKNAKKSAPNPIRPEDQGTREKVDRTMEESMYVDTGQVKLIPDEGQMAWLVSAGPFEAVVSYKEREIKKIKFKTQSGEFEIVCKDYWPANGTHRMPRYLMLKNLSGENYQVEITNLMHYNEKEDDLIKRLKKWDELLRGKESTDPRPEFLL